MNFNQLHLGGKVLMTDGARHGVTEPVTVIATDRHYDSAIVVEPDGTRWTVKAQHLTPAE